LERRRCVPPLYRSYTILYSPSHPTATSNAPTIGRKRRLSDEDGDGDDARDAGSSRKRRVPLEREGTSSELGELRSKGTEIDPGVKEVTRGVKEVELEDKKEGRATNDDGKGTAEEASTTPEGETEPSAAPPHDPAPLPQGDEDDRPSTVLNNDEEAPIVHSEAIAAEAPSNDSPEEPLTQVEDEKESTDADAAPAVVNDGATRAAELVDPSPEPDTTTSSAEANDGTLQEQPEQ
jgi:hypothetical protein